MMPVLGGGVCCNLGVSYLSVEHIFQRLAFF